MMAFLVVRCLSTCLVTPSFYTKGFDVLTPHPTSGAEVIKLDEKHAGVFDAINVVTDLH